MQYVTKDSFETVTFYNNKVEKAEVKPAKKDAFELQLDFSVRKYRDGAEGKALDLNDFKEIGVYDED